MQPSIRYADLTRSLRLVPGILSLALASTPTLPAHGRTPTPEPRTITRIEQLLTLGPEEARRSLPVRLQGIVTYRDPSGDGFYLQGARRGIYVNTPGYRERLAAGRRVGVIGRVDNDLSNFTVVADRVIDRGPAPLPKPTLLTREMLSSGLAESRWSRAEGVVQSVTTGEGGMLLSGDGPQGPFSAAIPPMTHDAAALIDAKVTVDGVCEARWTKDGRLDGFSLHVPSRNHLRLRAAAPQDPFRRFPRRVSGIMGLKPESVYNRKIHVRGTVTHQNAKGVFFITDGKTGLRVRPLKPFPCRIGDEVDVVGELSGNPLSKTLKNAEGRLLGQGMPPPPLPLTSGTALRRGHEGALVALEGRVLGSGRQNGRQSLLLQQGRTVFDAFLEGPRSLPTLPRGSEVSVSGIYVRENDLKGEPNGFRVLLRSPQDVEVLQTPAWWSLRYLLLGMGVLLIFGLMSTGWGVLLHRRLRWMERESQLEERYHQIYNNAHEMIYTLDLEGRLISLNRAGEMILGHSREEIAHRPFLDFVAPESRARYGEWLRDAKQGHPSNGEIEFLTPEGRRLHMEVTTHFLGEKEGERFWQGIGRDVTERKRLMEALEVQAMHDPLTDLPNRAAFHNRLAEALNTIHPSMNDQVGLLFLDLDGFKLVNDSFGHEAGDRLLVAVAERLTHGLRPGDTLARLGGDEFTILLPNLSAPDKAAQVAERLLVQLRQPFSIEGQELFVTASVGIACTTPYQKTPEELLRSADTAMYIAKSRGKSCYVLFDPTLEAPGKERLELETELRRALERGELEVYYQPIVCMVTGRLLEVEALVRWNHPLRGLIPAGQFIPLAEEIGLTNPISYWVLETACKQLGEWLQESPELAPRYVCVNLSANQLYDPSLVGRVTAILQEARLPATHLKIELTENLTLDREDHFQPVLATLSELGAELAMDDFGTGYSSLSYLQKFPITTLKIDKFFTAGIGKSREGEAIIRAVTAFSETLGLRVTAEGIETEEQFRALQAMGCNQGQGYFISQPQPGQSLSDMREGWQRPMDLWFTPPGSHATGMGVN